MSGEAFERRLRPVYDAIDGRSYKNAVKQAETALKKYPGNQLLRALRAFALQKCGRDDVAWKELQAIVNEGPESERVLHTMTFTYKALGRYSDIPTAYSIAAEKHPGNIEILVGLFGAFSKEMNFVKQQQVALKLAKVDPLHADKYGWWAASSVSLQARAAMLSGSIDEATKLLRLAETMSVRQAARGGGFPTYETLLMHVDILTGAGKHAEAIDTIAKATGAAAGLESDRLQLRAASMLRSGDLVGAALLYRDACLANVDDWSSWHLYLNCTLPGSAVHPGGAAGDYTSIFPVQIVGGLADAWDRKHLASRLWDSEALPPLDAVAMETACAEAEALLEGLRQGKGRSSAEIGGRGRVQLALAGVELVCRRRRLGLLTDDGTDIAKAVGAALPSLRSSLSCVTDLRPYLNQIDPRQTEAIAWLGAEVKRECREGAERANSAEINNGENNGAFSEIKAFQCLVNECVLLQEMGLPAVEDACKPVEEAVGLIRLYADHIHLSDGLDPKERGYGEELVSAAATTLVNAWGSRDNGDGSWVVCDGAALPLIAALLTLEAAQVRRTVSAPLRLSACALYGLLGAPRMASAQFKALDIKAVLHESMTGQWILPILLAGAANEVDKTPWLDGISNLHIDQMQEASDAFFTAYEHGTYSKLPEFVDFWERMGRSYTAAFGRAEATVSALRAAVGDVQSLRNAAHRLAENTPQPAKETLFFAEDLATRPAWYPPLAADPRAELAEWWVLSGINNNARSSNTQDRPWWMLPGAGASGRDEAAQRRQALMSALKRRQRLPAMLSAALQAVPLSAADLAQLSGWVEEEQNGSLVSLLFTAAIDVHSIAGLHQPSGEMAVDAEGSLSTLQRELSAALQNVTRLLAGDPSESRLTPILSNQGAFQAACLVTEDVPWVASCLLSWITLFDVHHTDDVLKRPIMKLLKVVTASLHADLKSLDAALATGGRPSSKDVANRVMTQLQAKVPGIEDLWQYEARFDPHVTLNSLFEDQASTVERLRAATAKILSLLKPFGSKE